LLLPKQGKESKYRYGYLASLAHPFAPL